MASAPGDLEVSYHGNCFDGCASAALLSRFLQERAGRPLPTRYLPLQHQRGDPFPPGAFAGELNACVDFRWSSSPRLHWWFDHHASAFQPASDRQAYLADASGQKFWDPAAPSCTGLIARVLSQRFGWSAPELADLCAWADVIDAARFQSAAQAVRLEEPALRLMALLEATHDPALPPRVIEALQRRPLAEIAAQPWVEAPLAPVLERHRRAVETVSRLARVTDGVVEVDISETGLDGANKFIAYDLFPEARYTVVVSRDRKRSKVSVGSNPWSSVPRTHDISAICERYGGGGHPVVGAVSVEPDRLLDARRMAREIAAMLRGPAFPPPDPTAAR